MLGLLLDIYKWNMYGNNKPAKINNYRYSEVVQITQLQGYDLFVDIKNTYNNKIIWD